MGNIASTMTYVENNCESTICGSKMEQQKFKGARCTGKEKIAKFPRSCRGMERVGSATYYYQHYRNYILHLRKSDIKLRFTFPNSGSRSFQGIHSVSSAKIWKLTQGYKPDLLIFSTGLHDLHVDYWKSGVNEWKKELENVYLNDECLFNVSSINPCEHLKLQDRDILKFGEVILTSFRKNLEMLRKTFEKVIESKTALFFKANVAKLCNGGWNHAVSGYDWVIGLYRRKLMTELNSTLQEFCSSLSACKYIDFSSVKLSCDDGNINDGIHFVFKKKEGMRCDHKNLVEGMGSILNLVRRTLEGSCGLKQYSN